MSKDSLIKGNKVVVVRFRDGAERALEMLNVKDDNIQMRALDSGGTVIGYVYDGTGEWFFVQHEGTNSIAAYHREELEVLA